MVKGKKIFSLMLAVIMCISIVLITDLGVEASALTWGDYVYAVLDDGTLEITDYNGNATELIIPSEIDGKAVTRIGSYAFGGCDTFKSVIIPEGVTHISRQAFYDCTSLENITIPDSVTEISYSVFENSAYYNNKDNWTDGLLIIDGWVVAFMSDYVYIPANVRNIADGIFLTDIPAIKSFEVDNDNKYYSVDEYGVLYNKDKTKLINYPSASKNKTYIIPDTVEKVEVISFYLENLIIPDSVKEIGAISYSFKNAYFYGEDTKIINTEYGFGYFPIDQEKWFEVRDEYEKLCEEYVTHWINGTITEEYLNEFSTKSEKFGCFWLENIVPFGTIHAPENSTAQAYANEKGINFKVLEPHTHTYGEWYTVTEATVFAQGEKRRDCDCGEYETETIAKLENAVVEDTATGVEITYTGDNFDSAVEIVVSEDAVNANIAFGDEYENYKAYDISLEINGEKVQPEGFVTVKLPLPEGYNADTTKVYYVDDNGEKTLIESTVENGYIIFETDHFSEYVIVDESSKIETPTEPEVPDEPTTEPDEPVTPEEPTEPSAPTDDCSCNCHAGGIKAFFFKILNFFQKLFGKNKICTCGAKH